MFWIFFKFLSQKASYFIIIYKYRTYSTLKSSNLMKRIWIQTFCSFVTFISLSAEVLFVFVLFCFPDFTLNQTEPVSHSSEFRGCIFVFFKFFRVFSVTAGSPAVGCVLIERSDLKTWKN